MTSVAPVALVVAGGLNRLPLTLDALMFVGGSRASVETIIERVARDARAEGKTWQEIGDALGMSRQAAQERFRA